MKADLQPQAWSDAVARLKIWPQEYDQFPDNIPKTNCDGSTDPDTPVYKPGRQADLLSRSSPVRTRQQTHVNAIKGGRKKDEPESPNLRKRKLGYRPKVLGVNKKGEDSEDGESRKLPSRPSGHTGKSIVSRVRKKGKGYGGTTAGEGTGITGSVFVSESIVRFHVSLGLLRVVILISIVQILRTMEKSISASSSFLIWYESNWHTTLDVSTSASPFGLVDLVAPCSRFTLTCHGYTVIAKGVQIQDVPHLKNESKVHISPPPLYSRSPHSSLPRSHQPHSSILSQVR